MRLPHPAVVEVNTRSGCCLANPLLFPVSSIVSHRYPDDAPLPSDGSR